MTKIWRALSAVSMAMALYQWGIKGNSEMAQALNACSLAWYAMSLTERDS